jgi:hypothetical protein
MNWQFVFGLYLITFSIMPYVLHYYIFGDDNKIFLDLPQYIAFVPIQMSLVALVIGRLLIILVREKRTSINKLNMAIWGLYEQGVNGPV